MVFYFKSLMNIKELVLMFLKVKIHVAMGKLFFVPNVTGKLI